MNLLRLLPQAVKERLLVKAILVALDELSARHVGRLLDQALDQRFGGVRSEQMQASLVGFLKTVVMELEEDHA